MRGEQGNPEITVYCPKCDDRVVPLRSGLCGWCDTDLTPDMPESVDSHPEQVETPTPPPEEEMAMRKWRDDEIVAWVRNDGPKLGSEICDHFHIPRGSQGSVITRLRAAGLIEKTGVERLRDGSTGGRKGPEFHAVEPGAHDSGPDLSHETPSATGDREPPTPPEVLGTAGEEVERGGAEKSISERIAERRDLGLTIDPTPFGDRPDASERTRAINEEVKREIAARFGDFQDEPEPAAMTVHESLVVRYLNALIGRVERAGMGGIAEPPDHVYERIERLLEIEEGVK